MKVLGIAGSPRKGGNTDTLLAEVLRGAASKNAKIKLIALRELKIIPCTHSDYCLGTGMCNIQDDMQAVYRELEDADRIILASPVQFMGLTSQMKAMIDRCQSLWARKYILKVLPLNPPKERRGFFISVGGSKARGLFEPSLATVKSFFVTLNVVYAGDLLFPGMDEKGSILKHPEAMQKAFEAGAKLTE